MIAQTALCLPAWRVKGDRNWHLASNLSVLCPSCKSLHNCGEVLVHRVTVGEEAQSRYLYRGPQLVTYARPRRMGHRCYSLSCGFLNFAHSWPHQTEHRSSATPTRPWFFCAKHADSHAIRFSSEPACTQCPAPGRLAPAGSRTCCFVVEC